MFKLLSRCKNALRIENCFISLSKVASYQTILITKWNSVRHFVVLSAMFNKRIHFIAMSPTGWRIPTGLPASKKIIINGISAETRHPSTCLRNIRNCYLIVKKSKISLFLWLSRVANLNKPTWFWNSQILETLLEFQNSVKHSDLLQILARVSEFILVSDGTDDPNRG